VVRRQETGVRGQGSGKTGDREKQPHAKALMLKKGDRRQVSGVRGQRSGGKGQKSEIRRLEGGRENKEKRREED